MFLTSLLLSVAPQSAPPLTLEQAGGRGDRISFRATLPAARWAPDGVHVEVGTGDSARWIDPRTGAESAPERKAGREEPGEEPGEGRGQGQRSRRGRPADGPRRELAEAHAAPPHVVLRPGRHAVEVARVLDDRQRQQRSEV